MISGFGVMVASVEIILIGLCVSVVSYVLYHVCPPFKKFFDKLVNGDL